MTYAQSGPGGYGKTDEMDNLVLWLKADSVWVSDGVNAADGNDVFSWQDQSGYGYHAVAGTNTPSFVLSDANFNGEPSLLFDEGNGEFLFVEDDGGEAPLLDGTDEMSIFYVFRSNTNASVTGHMAKRDGYQSAESYSIWQQSGTQRARFGTTQQNSPNSSPVGATYINSITFIDGGSGGEFNQWLNQSSGAAQSGGSIPANDSDLNIGNFDPSNADRFFDGNIAEIIIFREYLTDAERIVVETYLASKYGITITDDFWDEATYSTYDNEIAGIGQNDVGSIANSATSSMLTLAGGDDRENGEWLFWGHDADDITSYTSIEGVDNRLEREWVINETGDLGDMTISIAVADLPATGLAAPSFNVLVDDDGDFNAGFTSYNMTLNGANYEATVNINEGEVVTISYDSPAPAGVSAALSFWLDADSRVLNGSSNPASDGENIAIWEDLSSNSYNATNGTSPAYNTSSAINYRPAVNFDAGNSEFLEIEISDFESDDFTIVGIVRRGSGGGIQNIMGSATNVAGAMSFGYGTNTSIDGRTNSTSTVSSAVSAFDSPVETQAVVALQYDRGATSLMVSEYRDGISNTSTNASATDYVSSIQGNIGRALAGNHFDGDIAELVAFPSSLVAQDIDALISNFAMQYGVSLSRNYTDEAGVVLWDFSENNTDGFMDDVMAIGFDESFALDQRVSKSATDSLVLATSSDFLSLNSDSGRPVLADGQMVFIANDDDSYTLNQTFNLTSNSQVDRTWRVDEIGAPGAVVIAIPKSIGTLNFMLVSSDKTFASGVQQVALFESGDYYYATHDFTDGDYFTFALDDTEIWYSYKSGVWSDWTNWTLDGAVSALLVNPDNKVPLPGDSVVVKSGNTITVDVQDISVESLEINGILDLATTGGHDFNYFFGFGKLRMAGFGGVDNYPSGIDTLFYDFDEGGTVELYGGDVSLPQDRTFRNLIVNLDLDNNVATMLGNTISLTKDLTVTSGDLQFNDNSSTSSINLTVNGNILIEPDGSMLVGTGNARHELDLFGDFTNQGLIEFTNRNSANTSVEATDGIVDLNFKSADQDQAFTLQNTARLYRIEIDKGVDDAYILDITSDDPSYWNLFGFANQGHGSDNQLVAALDENLNALGLYFGTVKIGTNVDIPVLGAGNYNISVGAQIWVDGGSVSQSANAIVPYGTLRITAGTIEADVPNGITTRGNATLIIEGGTVTTRQFRTSVEGSINQGGLVQTGGVFNVTGETNGSINGGYVPFNLTYEGNVFNVSGGTINVSGANVNGGIFIGSDPENISTTGGVVNFIGNTNNDFIIASRASFYNLTMEQTSGSGNFIIAPLTTGPGGSDNRTIQGDSLNLTIINDLSINESGSSTVFDANGADIGITGTLTVQTGATMTMTNNTLTFEGEGTSFVDIGTVGPLALDSLVINKDLDTDLVRITNGPDRALTIANYFNHMSGRFDYQADTVVLSGDLVLSDTIGLDSSRGELLLNGGASQLITSTDDSGVIYDLVIDNANGITLTGNLQIDSLVLDAGIFEIGTYELQINSDLSTNQTFSNTLKIETAGNASDGGLNIFIGADDTYVYPIGVSGKYTPAVADVSLSSGDDGFINIKAVDESLSLTNQAGTNELNYYWRVNHTDFGSSDLPTINSYNFTYVPGDASGGTPEDDYVAGKVLDELPYTRAYEGDVGVQVTATGITFDGLAQDNVGTGARPGFEIENANYLAGDPDRFTGSPTIYYSVDDPDDGDLNFLLQWNNPNSWTDGGVVADLDGNPGIDARDWHRGDQVRSASFPQAGDVAIIGFIPWEDPNVTWRGAPHHLNLQDEVEACARLEFTQLVDASGNPTSRDTRRFWALRPSVLFTDAGSRLDADVVEGEGEFFIRFGADPDYSASDLGGFLAADSSIMFYEAANNRVYNNLPELVPNLVLGTSNWGNNDRNIEFSTTVTTVGNLEILGDANLVLSNGADGDLAVGANFIMFQDPGGIVLPSCCTTGASGGGARLYYPNSGNSRSVTIAGDIRIDNAGGMISVNNPGTTPIEHSLRVSGNIVINSAASGDDGLRLWTDATEDFISLTVSGEDSTSLTLTSGDTPQLYRLIVDKGSDTTSVFTLEDNVGFNAENTSYPQSIQLSSGKLIFNDPAINVQLADNSEFRIPLGAGLEVSQGTVSTANDASINLDGLLRINGGTATLSSTDIIYSNTGEALIDISSGSLTVGNQIRRPLTTSSGILKYRQSGGTVLVGADGESENERAMFEVLNPGSEFTLSGGSFTIRRGVTGDDNPSLELDPDDFSVTGSTILLGDASTPAVGGSNFFNIKSAIPLNNLTIDDDADFPVARAFSLALTVDGTFEIQTNGDFDANGFQITLNGDLDNDGTYTNDDDLTLFSSSDAQEIRGSGSFTIHDLTKNNSGTLSLSTGPVVVNNDLRVEQGTLSLDANVLELKGDAYIESVVSNTTGGYLSFNSDLNNQNLYGLANNTITLGKMQIDNPLGVDIVDGFGYNFDITQELALLEGVFNVGGSLVTVREGGTITGDLGGTAQADFSINNMVQTNSSFVDNGLKIEYFTLVSDSTLFFPVGEQKYTPVAFDLLSTAGTGSIDSEGGSIRVRPANERHPTVVNNVEPNPDISMPAVAAQLDLDDITNVLQYYWIVVADDIDATGVEGSATFFYDADDISLDNSPDAGDPTNSNNANPAYGLTPPTTFTAADYVSARLLSNGTDWDKFTPDLFDEGTGNFTVPLGSGILAPGITGDYTAGIGSNDGTTNNIEGAIPDQIVEYVSNSTGTYGTDGIWSPNPGTGIGPVGGRVTVSTDDIVTIDANGVRLYEMEIESGGTLVVDGSTFNHRLGNVSGTGTIRLDGTGNLPTGEYSAFFDCDGGALDYSGSGTYNVLGSISQIRKVSFTGSDSRIMPSNILEVCDTLSVNGPILALNTGQSITIGDVATANDLFWIQSGTVTQTNGTNIDLNGSMLMEGGSFSGLSGTQISIYENLTRTAGTLDWNNTSVTMDGAAAQTITGDFTDTREFNSLTINNSSATGVTVTGDVEVTSTLTLTDGHMYTSDDDSLILDASGDYASASAASHIKGPLVKQAIAGTSNYDFPVGKGSRYAPVRISETASLDNWKAEYFTTNSNGTSDFDATDPGSGFGELQEIASDMWTVESEGNNTARVQVTYGPWHGSSDQNDLRLVLWDGAEWTNQGGNPISGDISNGTVTSENTISFSSQDFTLGAVSEDALPVEMLYFEGIEDRGVVQLDWATATEIDNDYFEVQRSQEGRDWEVIGVVTGAGTTVEEQQYVFDDSRPYVGNSYYRLRQVDYDGQFAFTDIILVSVRLESISFNVYPNPIEDAFTLDIKGINANEEATYSIISLQGAYVGDGVLRADEGGRINEQLSLSFGQPSGIYILRVGTSQRVFRFNLIKK